MCRSAFAIKARGRATKLGLGCICRHVGNQQRERRGGQIADRAHHAVHAGVEAAARDIVHDVGAGRHGLLRDCTVEGVDGDELLAQALMCRQGPAQRVLMKVR